MHETGVGIAGGEAGGVGTEYVSRRWRGRAVGPSQKTLRLLPVEVVVVSDDTDYDPLYEARSVRPLEAVRQEDDDSLVDPQTVFAVTDMGDVLAEGSYLAARRALDRLRASVIRTLALPGEFHRGRAVLSFRESLPEGPADHHFDPAGVDVGRLTEKSALRALGMINEVAAAAAHLGAKLLDSVEGGWYTRVDPHTLDQNRDLWCVLAQVYGTYQNGLFALGHILEDAAVDFGFDSGAATLERCQVPRYYEYLTICWQYEISRRRSPQPY